MSDDRRQSGSGVPFERSALGLIYVSADLDGHPLRMIVDTGANRTILDKAAADRLGIVPEGPPLDVAGCITNAASEADVGALRVGPVLLGQRAIAVLDLGSMKQKLGEIDGIIGGDFLAGTKAVIDYGADELRLHAPVGGPAR